MAIKEKLMADFKEAMKAHDEIGSFLEIQQHKDCNCKQHRKDHCPEENWFSSTDSDTEKWKESDS